MLLKVFLNLTIKGRSCKLIQIHHTYTYKEVNKAMLEQLEDDECNLDFESSVQTGGHLTIADPILNKPIILPPVEKYESKSRRLNLILKPSIYEAAQIKCKKSGISMNECINQLLKIWSSQP